MTTPFGLFHNLYAPGTEMGHLIFCPVCGKKTKTLAITFELRDTKRYRLHIWLAYSTYETFSNDIRVNDLDSNLYTLNSQFGLCCCRGYYCFTITSYFYDPLGLEL